MQDKIVSKSYPFHVKAKIEYALQQWLAKNIKSYQIVSIETDESKATKTVYIEFGNLFEARRFETLRIPQDLFRWKWEKRLE
jgi:hypothetical protein